MAVDLLLASAADLIEDLQCEPNEVERVRDHYRAGGVGGRLEPGEQTAGDHLHVGALDVSMTAIEHGRKRPVQHASGSSRAARYSSFVCSPGRVILGFSRGSR